MSGRILFVVNVDWFFLSHRLPIALEALRQGYEVHIATQITDRMAELQSHGLVVHRLNLNRNSAGPIDAFQITMQLFTLFKALRPHLVHLVTIKPVVLGGIAARIANVPAVVAAVSGLGYVFVARGLIACARRWLLKPLYRAALGHSNLKVIFQNKDDQASLVRLVKLRAGEVTIIPGSGVDLTRYIVEPLPSGVPLVIMAARLLADKGVREFVESARLYRLTSRAPKNSVRFVLVGTTDLPNPTSVTASELSQWARDGDVELWGYRADMPNVMAKSHIVVLPSYYGEGLPKVLVEAAACGRAVVTTDHPGCRDAIVPGKTGLLVPARNARALLYAIKYLLACRKRCVTMGQAGRVFAESEFDVKKIVDAHLNIYRSLLASAGLAK